MSGHRKWHNIGGIKMTKEQKAIERLWSSVTNVMFNVLYSQEEKDSDTRVVLNLIQKQQREIGKLKKHNKDLLRKLKNRVKEVKKLIKYSLYKKEFSRLNKELEKKDKIIDEIIEELASCKDYMEGLPDSCQQDCFLHNKVSDCNIFKNCKYCIKQYFEGKVNNEEM